MTDTLASIAAEFKDEAKALRCQVSGGDGSEPQWVRADTYMKCAERLLASPSPTAGDEGRVRAAREAFSAFSRALSLPDGPDLLVQRHDPSWEAWKNLCEAMASLAFPAAPADGVVEALRAGRDALLKMRTASIKGCDEGYGKPEIWAGELFASHGDATRAVQQIDAALSRLQADTQGDK